MKIISKQLKIFHLSEERQKKVTEQIRTGAEPDLDFYVMSIFSGIIVTLGIIVNSGAVIIGGMLIAPLVWPVLAISIAIIKGSTRLLQASLSSFLKASVLILLVSFFIGLLSPFHEFGSEFLSRARPTIIELFIALAAGFIGAFVIAFPKLSSAIAGVVIATAIVPPLSVMGLSLAEKNLTTFGGSLLLVVVNLIAVIISSSILFLLTRFRPPQTEVGKERRRYSLVWAVVLLIVIAIPLLIITSNTIKVSQQESTIREIIMSQFPKAQISQLHISEMNNVIFVRSTLQATDNLTRSDVEMLTSVLSDRLNQSVNLQIMVIPTMEAGKEYIPKAIINATEQKDAPDKKDNSVESNIGEIVNKNIRDFLNF